MTSGGSRSQNRKPVPRTAKRKRSRREERPYVIVLFGLLMVIGAMAVGPVRSLAAANERVDQLMNQRDVLAGEVDALETERADLNVPAEQEVYAREQLGLVMPGDVPYVVLPDDATDEEPQPPSDETDAETSWFDRVTSAIGSLFDR